MKKLITIAALGFSICCAAQTSASLFWNYNKVQVPFIVSEAEGLYRSVGHHGPAVENTHMALRIYFNQSGAIDVYSKSGKVQDELGRYHWYPTSEQMAREGAGCDEYFVGKSLGLGGINLWDGEKAVKLVPTEGREARVGKTGHGHYAEMIVRGVAYKGGKVNVSLRIDVRDGSRIATVTARELDGKKVQFVTGVNYHTGSNTEIGKNYLCTWGTHPADVSKNPIQIGGALVFRPQDFETPKKTDVMLQLISNPTAVIRTKVISASTKESDLPDGRTFFDFVRTVK